MNKSKTDAAKVVLVQTLTTLQRTGMVLPPVGTLVYDTTLGALYFYDGSAWEAVTDSDTVPVLLQSATPGTAQTGHINISGTVIAAAFAGMLTGSLTGNASGSSGSCTGNAATATKLATARAINGTNFDGSAAITVSPPAMDTTARLAISNPTEGLTVYDTTLHLICFYNGSAWLKVTATAADG